MLTAVFARPRVNAAGWAGPRRPRLHRLGESSPSVRSIFDDMRRVGATARLMLIAAAANRWNVAPGGCIAKDHEGTHLPTRRALGLGERALEAGGQKIPASADVVLRPRTERVHLGMALPLLDGP